MASAELPQLGVGIVYVSPLEPLLERRPDLFQVIEFEPQTTWIKLPERQSDASRQPYRADRDALAHVAGLPGRKIVHSIGTPVGGTVRPDAAQLALLRETVAALDAPWVSDHLSFNRTPDFATGFFLPPRQTAEGVGTAVRAIADLQAALPVPVAVETGVSYLRPRTDEMPDGEFVARVVEAADCGILLDLHNIYCNSLNGRQPVESYLAELPLERVWEVHLAGGMEMDGFWLDAHSGPIPPPLLDLAVEVIPRLPNLKAVIFEVFPSFIPVIGLDVVEREMERLHGLWSLRRPGRPPVEVAARAAAMPSSGMSPAEWERALAAAILGRGAAIDPAFADEPGIGVVQGLVQEFSASMIVRVLRLTSRLLMQALGPDAFRLLLRGFWSQSTPGMYANVEAEAFAGYLEALHLPVPHLDEILGFERAAMATLIDGVARVVPFGVEPLPLLRALAAGRVPDEVGRPGRYEIEVTGDSAEIRLGIA